MVRLDLPDVIELKKNFQKETDNRKYISSSFLDTNWFDKIVINDNILFISAGFLFTLRNWNKELRYQDSRPFGDSEMFFDVTSPKGRR